MLDNLHRPKMRKPPPPVCCALRHLNAETPISKLIAPTRSFHVRNKQSPNHNPEDPSATQIETVSNPCPIFFPLAAEKRVGREREKKGEGEEEEWKSVILDLVSKSGEEEEFLSITCLCVQPTSIYQVHQVPKMTRRDACTLCCFIWDLF
ncbi:hypothetical protein L1887_25480 [Cichorium endivia]|nr:hypothetical protein L1887_25480 [Cichorium endivia]